MTATAAGALALGLLPDIAQAVPGIGDSLPWLCAWAAVAVLVVGAATQALRSKDGVGIVIYLGAGSQWDRSRLQAMRDDALQRHAACFVVEPEALLRGVEVSDRVEFAYRVMQARLEEESGAAGGAAESVSFYVTARHADAYRLGGLLRAQLHESVAVFGEEPAETGQAGSGPVVEARLMGQSEERGRAVFPAVGLDSALKRAPDAADEALLRSVLGDPEQGPEWRDLAGPAVPNARRRIALVVSVADNPRMVDDALRAAETGDSAVYRFPGAADPEMRRCVGALVVRTLPGNIPDRAESYEALIRYVVHHWRRAVEEHEVEDVCWLFTDGPVTLVLAFGALLGRSAQLVPHQPTRTGGLPAPSAPTEVVGTEAGPPAGSEAAGQSGARSEGAA